MFSMIFALVMPVPAQRASGSNLSDKSLEDLMSIEVVSVSKKEQSLSRVASAVFVITQSDIRHSGATNIPALLRLVPGLDVARINSSTWAVSARGFNSEVANKLLVLIDGRTVYSPVFAGVYWDVQDVPLEDIDRIEVIRGPGATVWGANAVNGVINIITKSSKDTQGGLVTAAGGTHEQVFGVGQYGGQLTAATSYRLFVKGLDFRPYPSLDRENGNDEFTMTHAGFRLDSTLSPVDSLTAQGDLYGGREGELINAVYLTAPFSAVVAAEQKVSGGNVLGRWSHGFNSRSDATLQLYFDRANRSQFEHESIDTTDLDFQHHLALGTRHDFVWGVGYRRYSYATTGSLYVAFRPASAAHQVFSSFVQDEITLQPEHLYLTVGAKLEHNDFSGFEFQPSVRAAWSITEKHMVWAGYSRARRTPAILDRALVSGFSAFPGPGGVPVLLTANGSSRTVAESEDAYEAGYRSQLRPGVSLDLAAFYSHYDQLQTFEPGTTSFTADPQPAHLNVSFNIANNMHGETHGVELSVNLKLTDRWTLRPGYAFERIHLHTSAASRDGTSVVNGQGGTPHHQAQILSTFILPHGLDWNAALYFVDRLSANPVPSYTRLDTGLDWKVSEHFTFSVVGQNLVRNTHFESDSPSQTERSSLIKRAAYAKLAWRF